MIIAFLGPPGSGKGTQAKQLAERYGFEHFDTGARLRQEADSGSPLGQRIAGYINEGNLVPIEVIKELVLKFLRETDAERIMFDGFPRNLDQARVFDEGLAEAGRSLTYALYLHLDPATIEDRILNRRTCEVCGRIYNLISNRPASDEVCDLDGGKLVLRADDTPEKLKRRIEVYFSETVPVLEHYREQGKLQLVSADKSIEEVTQSIVEMLGVKDGAA